MGVDLLDVFVGDVFVREINLENETIDFAEVRWLHFGFPQPLVNQDKRKSHHSCHHS